MNSCREIGRVELKTLAGQHVKAYGAQLSGRLT